MNDEGSSSVSGDPRRDLSSSSLAQWFDGGNGCSKLIDLVERNFEVAYHRQRLISWNSTHTRDLIRCHKEWKQAQFYIWKEYQEASSSSTRPLTEEEEAIDRVGLIQACLAVDCPEVLLRTALHLNPNNDMMKNDDSTNHQGYPLHILCQRYSNQLIQVAVQSCPEACGIVDDHVPGKFPLTVYLERQRTRSSPPGQEAAGMVEEPIQRGLMIDILLEANPGALASIPNIDVRLYPWIWSRFSVKRRKGWNRRLDSQRFFGKDLCRTALFRFIRSSPHVFATFA